MQHNLKLVKKALIQSNVFKQAINVMSDAIKDMDIELEQKDIRISLLENKIGIADDKVVEEQNRLDLNKLSNKEEGDRIMNKLCKTPNNHKEIKK